MQYDFDPQDGDTVDGVSGDFKALEQLEREAARWATRFVDEQHSLDVTLARIDAVNERLVNGEQQVRDTMTSSMIIDHVSMTSDLLFN